MSKPIKSRDGLTRCTSCRTHIRADETPSQTNCPFCGANLHRSRSRITLPTGRGGVLAASLFAFTAVGCGGGDADEQVNVEPADDTSGDDTSGDDTSGDDTSGDDTSGNGPNNNNGSDDQFADDPPDDNTAVAEYGIAPPADEPMYGLPPG